MGEGKRRGVRDRKRELLVKTGFNGSVGGDSIAYVIFGVLPPPPFLWL